MRAGAGQRTKYKYYQSITDTDAVGGKYKVNISQAVCMTFHRQQEIVRPLVLASSMIDVCISFDVAHSVQQNSQSPCVKSRAK